MQINIEISEPSIEQTGGLIFIINIHSFREINIYEGLFAWMTWARKKLNYLHLYYSINNSMNEKDENCAHNNQVTRDVYEKQHLGKKPSVSRWKMCVQNKNLVMLFSCKFNVGFSTIWMNKMWSTNENNLAAE